MSVRAAIGKSQGAGLEGPGANMDTVSMQVLVLQQYCLGPVSLAFRSPPKGALDLIDSFLWLREPANQGLGREPALDRLFPKVEQTAARHKSARRVLGQQEIAHTQLAGS